MGVLSVYVLALSVVAVDFLCRLNCSLVVRRSEQFHRHSSGFHSSGRVDSRPYLEYDVVNREVSRLQSGKRYHCLEALARVFIQPLEPEVRKNPILSGHGYEVGRNAHCKQIKQGLQRLERYAV